MFPQSLAQFEWLGNDSPMASALLGAAIILIIGGTILSLRSLRQRRAAGPATGSGHCSVKAGAPTQRPAADPDAPSPETVGRLTQAHTIRQDLEGLMLEVEEMARRVAAQLDNKTTRLDTSLDEADRRIRRLKELLRDIDEAADRADRARARLIEACDRPNQSPPAPAPSLTPEPVSAASAAGAPALTLKPTPDPTASAPRTDQPPASTAQEAQNPRAADEPIAEANHGSEASATVASTASLRDRVYALADDGLDAAAIADRLGEARDRVDLALKLRRPAP